MKRVFSGLGAALFIGCAAHGAPGVTNSTIPLAWTWPIPNTGGLSTNDYLTNVVFVLYSAANVAGPYTIAANLAAGSYQYLGTNTFAADFPASNQLQFFELTSSTAGGESLPSNRLPILPIGAGGTLYLRGK